MHKSSLSVFLGVCGVVWGGGWSFWGCVYVSNFGLWVVLFLMQVKTRINWKIKDYSNMPLFALKEHFTGSDINTCFCAWHNVLLSLTSLLMILCSSNQPRYSASFLLTAWDDQSLQITVWFYQYLLLFCLSIEEILCQKKTEARPSTQL